MQATARKTPFITVEEYLARDAKPNTRAIISTEFESLDDVAKLTSIDCELALKDVDLKVNF